MFEAIKRIKKITLVSALFLLATSCVKEDRSRCDLFLKFRYDYNMTSEDLFGSQVERVAVFVFDVDGNYLTTLSEEGDALKANNYSMKIPRSMYGCTMVVWAGNTERFYSLPTLIKGDNIGKLTLEYKPEGGVSPRMIDNLWHSGPVVMLFPEMGSTTQTVGLVRDTNDFDIQINNKNGESLLPAYKVDIKTANGSYDYKNKYLSGNQRISYVPYNYTEDNVIKAAQIRILRLVENDSALLSITNDKGMPVDIGGSTTINLIEYILKSNPVGMTAQEYLDRRYQWDISLTIDGSTALSIQINDWVHWFHPTEL